MKKSVEIYGPLVSSWTIRWSDSGGTSHVNTRDRARATYAYFVREGRHLTATCTITRTESCPRCDGDGIRQVKKRGYMFLASVPCVGCLGRHDTLEDLAEIAPLAVAFRPLTEVLAALGYEHAAAGEFGAHSITRNGWEVFRGGASSTWDWLRETGQIL